MSSSLSSLKGIGPAVAAKFAVLGLRTINDLLGYLPRRYEDYSDVQEIRQMKPGRVTLEVTITNVTARYVRRGLHITEAVASDVTGSVRLVWFNQPFRATSIKQDVTYFLTGEYGLSRQRFSIVSPTIERADSMPIHTARIVPIYRETKGLNSVAIRKAIFGAFEKAGLPNETLPAWLVKKEKLLSYGEALYAMHFPKDAKQHAAAKKRLGFEEVFRLTLASLLNKQEFAQETALSIPFDAKLAKRFVDHLPFKLTNAQRRVLWQVFLDMERSTPMNRLIEGDVGSGKTVVAAMAAAMAMGEGFQVAYMAPTEILARQHATHLYDLFKPLGMERQVGLLVGGLKPAQKKEVQQRLKNGDVRFIIGTHALFTEKVVMQKLGLVIVDEQHRFGVEQRKKLQGKAHRMPHVLSMTATPIPRSLALTLYGELDISVIAAMPLGRKPILTKLVSPNSRAKMYEHVKEELAAGRQVYVVCPVITESDSLPAPSAEKVYENVRKALPEYGVGLLHGKLKPEEKDKVMQSFAKNTTQILVATTVIEVGVNVPNASVMIIEGAERFGLAQMHQLRGRVGRSSDQGYCYVIPSGSKAPSSRLRAFASTNDGFKLSELDLELRGPGAIYGTSQSGELDLRVAKLSDTKLIASARDAAAAFLAKGEDLVQYPQLAAHVSNIRAITNLN